jgi:Family of unknown function (DUF6428)
MNLRELKQLLAAHGGKGVRFTLPDGREVPAAYHLTEVGQVSKVFIDCGGKTHSETRCVLQLWLGDDSQHRLMADKFAAILELSRAVVASEDLEVEVEYEDVVISQYPLTEWEQSGDVLVLQLGRKHTDCLARHLCLPNEAETTDACCAPTSHCC